VEDEVIVILPRVPMVRQRHPGPGIGVPVTDVDLVVASEEALDLVLAGAEDTGEASAGVEPILLLEDGMDQPTMPLTGVLTP
jgi:hypothetical protein